MEISLAVSICLIMAAVLSSELGISSAVIEILCGVALVAIVPDIAHANWLSYLAHLGMLALMFVAGFELQVNKFRKIWRPGAAIGLPSFFLPFAGVFAYTRFGLDFPVQKAALVAVGLSTTSLALVYHVLKEQKNLETDEGQVIFGAASIVDVLSMVSLALLIGNVGWGTALFFLFFIVTAVGLPHFGGWIFRRYPNSMAEPELRFLMVILIGMGFMAETVGSIHPALVAFMVGMIMTSVVEKNEAVKDKLMGLVFSFFAPIFFLQAGTRISLGDIPPGYLLLAAALFALATSLKYLGSYLPAKLLKMQAPRAIGILFNYRLSFGIITANVGLETKLLSQELYGVILLVVVVSAALPGMLLRNRTKPAENGDAVTAAGRQGGRAAGRQGGRAVGR